MSPERSVLAPNCSGWPASCAAGQPWPVAAAVWLRADAGV